MLVRLGTEQTLSLSIHANPGLNFGECSSSSSHVRFIYDDDIRCIDHRDFLQLQSTSVVRRHEQDSLVDQALFDPERNRFLASANRLHEYDFESIAIDQDFQRLSGGKAKTPHHPSRGYAPHEDTVILRVDHCRPISQKRT